MKPFGELKTICGELLVGTSVTNQTKTNIGRFMNFFYKQLWETYNWRTIIVINKPLTLASGSIKVFLPSDIDVVYAISERVNNILLDHDSVHAYSNKFIEAVSNNANPTNYTRSGFSPLSLQPAANSTLTFVSSSTGDTSQSMRVWGLDADSVEINASKNLNGTSEVVTSETFLADSIIEVSKSAKTTGTITIKDASGNVLGRIGPRDYSNRHIRIDLQSPPDQTYTLYISGKKRFRELDFDEDMPAFECGDALIEYARAAMLDLRGKAKEAANSRVLAIAMIDGLLGKDVLDEAVENTDTQIMLEAIDEPLMANGRSL